MLLGGSFGSALGKKGMNENDRKADLRETIFWGEALANAACVRMRWMWRVGIKEESENAKRWFFAMMAILLNLADTLNTCRGPDMSKHVISLACDSFVKGLARIRHAAFRSFKEYPELVESIDAHCEILYERQQSLVDCIRSAEFIGGSRTEDLLQITIFDELFTNLAWWVFEAYVNGYRHHERGKSALITDGGNQARKRLEVCWTEYAQDRLAKTILALIPYTTWSKAKNTLDDRAIALARLGTLHSDVMLLESIVKNTKCYNNGMRPPVVVAIIELAAGGVKQLLRDLEHVLYLSQKHPLCDEGTLFFSLPLPERNMSYALIDAPMPDLMPYARSSRCHPEIKARARFLLQTSLRMRGLAKLLPKGYSFPQGTVLWTD